MDTQEIRTTATNILDGMKFNKEKLARNCIAICDLNERLTTALAQEQLKSAALALKIKEMMEAANAPSSHSVNDLPPEFRDEFRDLFSGLGKNNKFSGFPF